MATMSLREKISRAADAFVDIKVQNLPLQFYLSTLDGLADLFEDEIIPTPIPMKVLIYFLSASCLTTPPLQSRVEEIGISEFRSLKMTIF